MAPLPMRKDLDVLEACSPSLYMGLERLAGEEFALQGRKEALGHRSVIAIADRAHPRRGSRPSDSVHQRAGRGSDNPDPRGGRPPPLLPRPTRPSPSPP